MSTERALCGIEDDVLSVVLDGLYDAAYNPRSNWYVRSSDFLDKSHYNDICAVLQYLVDESPMAGIDVSVYRKRNCNGWMWEVRPSDVHGPFYYPEIVSSEIECGLLRQRLVEDSALADVMDEFSLTRNTARRHARGDCECDASVPELEYSRSHGWYVTR